MTIQACAECGHMVPGEHRYDCEEGRAAELEALRRFFADVERRAGAAMGGELPHTFMEAGRAAGLLRADPQYAGPYVRGVHQPTWAGGVALALGRAASVRASGEGGGAS
jgi:hypothetical protein